jgi:RES domain-containing protein
VKLPAGWRGAIDSLCHDVKPFEDSCFRSVELAWAHPDDVISGEGTKAKGGRFVPKGTRAVYASLDEETATREVTARKARLGGEAQISPKTIPVSRTSFPSERNDVWICGKREMMQS